MNQLSSTRVESKRIIVVLGMHRGGTSAIARSLSVLGVDLGSNLNPPGYENPTGFWEDLDCLAINEELLAHFGSSYDRLGAALRFAESDPWLNALKIRATELIKKKSSMAQGVWGFKDPRTSRLMSFWRPVIAASDHSASYLIAARNPISVARSLANRGIPPEKAYLLWLQHMVSAFVEAEGSKRVVVDYDLFLDQPSAQLQRIASALKLPRRKQYRASFDEFSTNFLRKGLRHSKFSLADCSLNSSIPGDVRLAYDLLSRLSTDEVAHDHPAVIEQFREFNSRLVAFSPVFSYASSLENDRANLSRVVSERDSQVSGLNKTIDERDNQLVAYQRQAEQFDSLLKTAHIDLNSAHVQIINLNQTVADLNLSIAERDRNVASLTQALAIRDEQIEASNAAIARHDAHIAAFQIQAEKYDALLKTAYSDLNSAHAQIINLNQAIADRDSRIAVFHAQVDQLADMLKHSRESLNDAHAQIAYSNQTIAERDSRIAAHQRQAGLTAATLKNTYNELNSTHAQILVLNHSNSALNEKLHSLNQSIAERDLQLRSLNENIATANSIIATMTASRSWRYTSLFRKATTADSTDRQPLQDSSDVHSNAQTLNPLNRVRQLIAAHLTQVVSKPDLPEPVEVNDDRMHFNSDFYLNMYPDVRENFDGDPFDHFVLFGRKEGRLGFLPPFSCSGEFERLNPDRATVLVVSHEASATGAPVLSLNMIMELKARYNVIVLLLNGGSLFEDLRASVDIIVGPIGLHGAAVVKFQVEQLLKRCRIRFAIINSAESRIVLPELARHFIPSVALIHEFASYTRPRNAIEETIFWASETIFSAEIVRDNAVSAFPSLSSRLPAVIPQGRCSYALTIVADSSSIMEAERISRTFRPAGWPDDTLVVLGVGSVHLRKGVDLFVASAARVSQSVRCRFVWIGKGYDPDRDTEYSSYLEDQVKRAGLEDCFAFMNETSRIDFAYEKADILVVSSRLDPLPNVSVDAVSRGLPIVCFDKATGIADILKKNGLANECVAPYLDVERLSLCVIAFLENPDLRQTVGIQLKEISERTFNMATYVEQVENIALGWTHRAAQESADCATIAQNPLLDLNYLAGPFAKEIGMERAIRKFVRSWQNGFFLRKPYAGFHPGIYLEQCGDSNLDANPLADYMRAGSPDGPWCYEVIDPSLKSIEETTARVSVALHLHIFYPELAPIIIQRLNANRMRPDLFISVPSEIARNKLEEMLLVYEGKTVDIQVVPNRGRDIGAFLTAFGNRTTSQYEFIGHFHTKKTAEQTDGAMGKIWFFFLLENLIGGRYKMVDVILDRMSNDTSVGLVFPDDPHVIGWSDNRNSALSLAAKMGLPAPKDMAFNFPIGTMFWARSSAIRQLIALNLDWNDYPQEPLSRDGTMLHSIERLLPFVAKAAGFRSVVTNVPEANR